MLKVVMGQQNSYNTLTVVHSTMYLMYPNQCHVTIDYLSSIA